MVVLLAAGWIIYQRHQGDPLPSSSSTTQLTIKRDNTLSQPYTHNFIKEVSHSSAVVIMEDMRYLQKIQDGAIYHCPSDDGVDYDMAFTHPTLKATATLGGCQVINVGDKAYFANNKLWKDITKATGEPLE